MASTTPDNLAARIKSKRGYIRYLQNRMNDSTALEAEIQRHKEHAQRHLENAARLERVLADIPAALAQAHKELEALKSQLGKEAADPLDQIIGQQAAMIAEMQKRLAELENNAA